MSLDEIATSLGLPPTGNDAHITHATTDSREVRPGSLFICLPGSKVDGHDFAASAAANGALAIISAKELDIPQTTVFKVADPVNALLRLGRAWRDKTRARVVCITGTAGKTTLKDTLNSILEVAGSTASTPLNHNNQIGMPMAELAATGSEDYWILEAGISHAGDMDDLGFAAAPDLGIILNVGTGHTAGLGDCGVAWHKTRLLKYLSKNGMALASADYPELVRECGKSGILVNYFSVNPDSDARFKVIGRDPGKGLFTLDLQGEILTVKTPFMGEYGAEIAIAAATAARLLGVDMDSVQRGFACAQPPKGRFTLEQINGWLVLDDTYNANPLSMRRMLEAAARCAKDKGMPLIAVLGEMGELGSESEKCHEELGRLLSDIDPEVIWWKGGHLENVRSGYASGGGSREILSSSSREEFVTQWLKKLDHHVIPARATLIFKGSRANRLDEYLTAFRQTALEGGCVL